MGRPLRGREKIEFRVFTANDARPRARQTGNPYVFLTTRTNWRVRAHVHVNLPVSLLGILSQLQ